MKWKEQRRKGYAGIVSVESEARITEAADGSIGDVWVSLRPGLSGWTTLGFFSVRYEPTNLSYDLGEHHSREEAAAIGSNWLDDLTGVGR